MSDTTYAPFIDPIADDADDQSVDDDAAGFSSSLLMFAAVMTFIIMIVGICGNLLTVVALMKCPKVRNVAAAFIISLCTADLIFCALVLPFSALRFIQGTWTHGPILCKLIPFIQYGNIGVSLLCIAMITINRYVMIAHHGIYGKIYKRHWIAAMIAFCWLFSYGMQLPTLAGFWGKFDYDPKLATCSIMADANGRSSKTALFIIAFVIPCLIIIACYAKIFWVVHQSEMRMQRHAKSQNSIPNNLRIMPTNTSNCPDPNELNAYRVSSNVASSDSSCSIEAKAEALQSTATLTTIRVVKDQREARAKRNEWRITKMVLAIFLSFVICYLPITVAKVADKEVEHPVFQIFSYILLYLSACINPIIYVIMNKQYRKAYKTVIMCRPTTLQRLPFGKTGNGGGGAQGGSSAAEKWKDTGLSGNNHHSRTIVSQMSIGASDNSNSHSNSPTTTTLELTPKVSTTTGAAPASAPSSPPRVKPIGNCVPAMEQMAPSQSGENLSVNTTPQQRELGNRIALAEGDIILEEEEEEEQEESTTTTTMAMPPKKIPYYGPNINDTPGSEADKKLTTKFKI